jgi:DNA-binding MarR family transcriptional regulator
MDFAFFRELINEAEAYQKEQPQTKPMTVAAFAEWLAERHKSRHRLQPQGAAFRDVPMENLDGLVSMLIAFMSRYADFYARRVFKSSVLYSIDDFGVLAGLLPDRELKKADVIRMNILEKSSGNEVLKRLLKQGLIEEKPNPQDSRSKLIRLTTHGQAALASVQIGIKNLGQLVTGDLTIAEKHSLLAMLVKLNHFHQPIFEKDDEGFLAEKLGLR